MRKRAPGRRWGRARLLDVYARIRARYGPGGWWPGDGPFEVAVGAVLTQNTTWANAERALAGLRRRGLLSLEALRPVPDARLARLLRPAGTYRVKARRLRALLDFLDAECGGRVENLAGWPLGVARLRLLAVPGVGPETADAILLYAAGLPTFVVDAYTRRVFARLGAVEGGEGYEVLRRWFLTRLPRDVALFNDFHAQLVRLAKEHCRARPVCPGCPVRAVCGYAASQGARMRS